MIVLCMAFARAWMRARHLLDTTSPPFFNPKSAVRDAGFKVALVGSCGDELFGGYTTFRDLPALHH
jgi:asparagine synthetase B (glutamine-hydrolysing)